MHAGSRSVVSKIMKLGYYWPSMHIDVKAQIQRCKAYQIHSSVLRKPKQKMTLITSAWPIFQWGIDIVGPLLMAPGGARFLVVAIDYFTKWVEAKPLVSITGKHIEKLVWEHIVCRFGVPQIIVSDNGKQFAKRLFPVFAKDLVYSNPLLRLTCGSEAVVPIEISVETKRIKEFEARQNDKRRREDLDILEERREIASIREAHYKQRLEMYYNKRVRPSTFKPVRKSFGDRAYKLETLSGSPVDRTWNGSNLRKFYM
uniref:Reverse transcriptase domain-containing protein n=1 Tax=Tanacetum cinerariifolium TaxID=118510 RepID=A0A6L2KJY2_TANCI|nr:reverse transcriptase domain-containing protein [Tanacetum cinerariifolium]